MPVDLTPIEIPTLSQPERHYGSGPGFDAWDLWDVPKSAAMWGLRQLDRPAGGVRTLLTTGDLGAAANAVIDPETAASASDVRKKYLWGDTADHSQPFFNHSYNPLDWNYSQLGDVVGDLAVGAATDPLMYLHPGLTGAGRNVRLAGQEATLAGKEGAAQFIARTGKQAFNPRTLGLEDTLAGRLRAGEVGVQAKIPGFNAVPLPFVGEVAAPLVDAVSWPMRRVAATFGQTELGRTAGAAAARVRDYVTNPALRSGQGLIERNAQNLGHYEAQMLMPAIAKAQDRLIQSGIPHDQWKLVSDFIETIDPDMAFNPKNVGASLRPSGNRLRGIADNVVNQVQMWAPEQRAAFYATVQDLHDVGIQALKRSDDFGVGARLGDAIRKQFAEVDQQIAGLSAKGEEIPAALLANRAELEKKVQEIPNFFPGIADPEAVRDWFVSRGGSPTYSRGLGKQRSFIFPEGHALEGVPMTTREAEDLIKAQGGTAATAYMDPRGTIGYATALKNFFKKDGAALSLKEAEKASAFFTRDPAEAYGRYLTRSFSRAISRAELDRGISATFKAIPESAWMDAVKAAREGESFEAVAKTFKDATGNELESLINPRLLDTMKPEAALQHAAGPHGWYKPAAHVGREEGAFFLPTDVARRYDNYLSWANKRMPDLLRSVSPALKLWKAAQTWVWPDYHARNLVSDLTRMVQEGTWDAETVGDFGKLLGGLETTANKGFGDFSQFAKMNFHVGGGVQMTGDEVLKRAARDGLINTGGQAQLLFDAADGAANKLMIGQGVTDKVKRGLAFREDAERVAALLARLRSGDSWLEAGLRSEEALYNFARVSPAVTHLRQTGIAPFLGWWAKNIPAQVHWAFNNPGQFGALLRGAEMLNGGEISPELFPKYMRDQHNVIVDVRKGEDGKQKFYAISDSGILPFADLTEMLSRTPKETVFRQLGPLAKEAGEWLFGEEESTPSVSGGTGPLGKLGVVAGRAKRALTGEPDAQGRPAWTVPEVIGSAFSPVSIKEFDAQDRLKKATNEIKRTVSEAQKELKQAQVAFNNAMQYPQNREDPAYTAQLQERIKAAQGYLAQAQERERREMGEIEKTQGVIQRMNLVK